MKSRNVALVGVAAGAAAGGLAWYLHHRASEPVPVEAVRTGEAFPHFSGTTLAGEKLVLPEALAGRIGLLIMADQYGARAQVEQWAGYAMARYHDHPEIATYQVAVISDVGPWMQKLIDAAMLRGIPAQVQSHVLTVYGDLRWLRQRLGMTGKRIAYIYVIGRTGRITLATHGELTDEKRALLDEALTAHGIEERSEMGDA